MQEQRRLRVSSMRSRLIGSIALRKAYGHIRPIPGIGSVARKLAALFFPVGSPRWICVPRGPAKGRYMLVDPRYELGYVRGDHEPWLNDWLEQWLRPGDTVVDVGAHVGYFSVCGAAVVGPTGRVIAYEPDPDNYARLLRNLDRNDLTGIVETMRTAISDSHGERHFRRATSQSSRVEGRLAQAVDTSAEFILVAVHRLDDLLQHVQPHVIKVDVEGGEGEVLRGASRILQDRQTRWIIEVHNDMARQQVMEILSRAGYGVRLFRPVHPVYPDYRQEYAIAETD